MGCVTSVKNGTSIIPLVVQKLKFRGLGSCKPLATQEADDSFAQFSKDSRISSI